MELKSLCRDCSVSPQAALLNSNHSCQYETFVLLSGLAFSKQVVILTKQRRVTLEHSHDFILVPTGEGRSFSVVGDIYTFKAVGEDTGGAYSLFEFFIPPQHGSPPHIHNRENETFYILEGELSFQVGERHMTLPAGSFVHAPKGIPHSFHNQGKTPVRTLTMVVPAGLEKFFEEVGYPVTDKDTPVPITPAEQIKKMLEVAPKYGIEMLPPSALKTVNENITFSDTK